MIDIEAKVSDADVAKLGQAIDLMIKGTNRDAKNAVHRASYAFLKSAKANTPKATRKNRRIYRDGSGNQYYLIRRQGKAPTRILIPNATRGSKDRRAAAKIARQEIQAKYKVKPRVGASKASWTRAFKDLGKSAGKQVALREKRIAMASRAKKQGVAFAPSVRITNELSYLPKIAPNLERIAMAAAGKSLLHQVEKGIEKRAMRWK